MASKRKFKTDLSKSLKEKPESEEDEAIGKDLELDNSSEDSDDSDDSDSSVYSELEGEVEDDTDSEDDSVHDSDLSSDDDADDPIVESEKMDKTTDEYAYDSSDEEDVRNTIGNVPTNWYDEYKHIGYNVDGKKINKPKRGDELENFLSRMENPEHGVTVVDSMTGQNVVLSETDAEIVARARGNKVPQPGYDMYTEADDWFSRDVMKVPLRDIPESKKSFLPSHHERLKVGKMVHAIKMGWMKPRGDAPPKEDDPMEEARR